MRNRAKCKKCNSTIESMHSTDYVFCKCGEIAVDGGSAMLCFAKDWSIFVRVDDHDNEVIPKVVESINFDKEPVNPTSIKPTKKDLLDMLENMTKSYENLPQNALLQPVTHADLCSVLLLVLSVLRSD